MNALQFSWWKFAVIMMLCIILSILGFSAHGAARVVAKDDIEPTLDQSISYHTDILATESAAHSRAATYDCAAVSEIPQPECEALVALYEKTNGSSWATKADWLTTNTPCSWYGVTCIDNRVSELSLSNNALSGTLPSELGNLQNLKVLRLNTNQIGGTLPLELGNLSKLESLSLFRNQITGPIPSSFGNMSSLTSMQFHTNQLSGEIPAELGNLSNLGGLVLYSNELTGCIPAELGNLIETLRHVLLYTNKLSCPIPSSLGNLTNLLTLDLGGNELTGPIPPALGNLINLTGLHLSQNQLTGSIPSELSKLVSLESLSLYNNKLTGTIPFPLVDQPSSLKRVRLQNNLLSGSIPSDLGTLENLTYLDLSGNSLSGLIPPELGNLKLLNRLDLSNNRLFGSIPPEFGDLASLEVLVLTSNLLNGSIPAELGRLENLTYLDLNVNNLSGSIPPELGNLANLEELYLTTNRLSGILPPELGNLTNLERLSLFRNQITGTIPSSFGNMSSVTSMELFSNQLSGEIPAELGNMKNLRGLILYNNELTGCIPAALGNLNENLNAIALHNNKLSCTIPSSLGNLTNLSTLQLDGNELAGSIPTELGDLTNLTVLYLSKNRLSGPIPTELGEMTALRLLRLDDNQLNGQIPPKLGELQNLENLLLQNNLLSGEVPGELGALSKLLWLTVGGNSLSGPLPLELMNLNLERLWFDSPNICLPSEATFRTWIESIPERRGTDELCNAAVTVDKTSSQYTAASGDTIQYDIQITARVTTSIILTESLPISSSYTVDSVTSGAAYNSTNHEIYYRSSQLLPGETISVSYEVMVDSSVRAGSTLLDFTTVIPVTSEPSVTKEPIQRSVNVVVPDISALSTLLLIYAVGDNNLSADMIRLINNAERGLMLSDDSQLRVELLLDGPAENDTYLFSLTPDSDPSCPSLTDWQCGSRYVEGRNFHHWKTDDTANPYELAGFLKQAIRKYPDADQILVSLVGHGNGWAPNLLPGQPSYWNDKADRLGGMLWDEHPVRSLSTKALGQALQWAVDDTGRKIDLLFLDSCSMAMFEVVYELRNSTHYLLGSENLSWAAFPYDEHLKAIDGIKDARTIGAQWLQTEAERLASNEGHPYTYSLIDMEQIDELHSAVNQVASVLIGTLPASQATLQQIHHETDCFESNYDTVIDNRDSYCDLKSFMTQLQTTLGDTNESIAEASQQLLDLLEQTVVQEAHGNGVPWPPSFTTEWKWGEIGGLSIFLPLNQEHHDCSLQYYSFEHLQSAADGTWDDFVTQSWATDNVDQDCQPSVASLAAPLPVIPIIEFGKINYSEEKDNVLFEVEIAMSNISTNVVTVNIAISEATEVALSEIDMDKKITFPAGERTQAVRIELPNNDRRNDGKRVYLILSSPTNAVLGNDVFKTLTINHVYVPLISNP